VVRARQEDDDEHDGRHRQDERPVASEAPQDLIERHVPE
jgi:hypothetical protein